MEGEEQRVCTEFDSGSREQADWAAAEMFQSRQELAWRGGRVQDVYCCEQAFWIERRSELEIGGASGGAQGAGTIPPFRWVRAGADWGVRKRKRTMDGWMTKARAVQCGRWRGSGTRMCRLIGDS